MASLFKKTHRGKTRIVNLNDMLLMVEKEIRGGTCHAVHRYAKVNNKYIKIMIKTKNNHILNI